MISKEILKKIILEQNHLFSSRIEPIEREQMEELKKKSSSDFIIIISGIRRSGKSVLLSRFKNTQEEHSYYLNFDDERLHTFDVGDFEKLYEVFIELFGEQSSFYFDEIQNIEGWERFIRRLHDYGNKIYITGSNANLLSQELGTRLTGRYIQIELFPASFLEFLRFKNISYSQDDFYDRKKAILLQKNCDEYAKKGGFLKFLQTDESDFFKILHDNIVYRDIIAKYSITHKKGISDIFYYLISNVSKEFSYTTLKAISGISSLTTIKDYITYFEESYLLFTVFKYDFSLKKQLINPKKVYSIDTGMANSISFKFSENRGRVLENMVFLELKRRSAKAGTEIYYHSEKNKSECDFVLKNRVKGEIVNAIQVTESLANIDTREREIKGLLDAIVFYGLSSGIIITEDEEDEISEGGYTIQVIPLWKWLLIKTL